MKKTRKGLFSVLATMLAVLLIVGFTSICLAAESEESSGILSVGLTLDDSIIVRFKTSAEENDGSKVVVAYEGDEYELTKNKEGVFFFGGVAPQNLNSNITATLYSKDGAKIGDSVSFNTRDYLEALLDLSYEESGLETGVKYTAMRELAVDLLNYGAAAQTYTNTNVNDLANKNLTDEQKALATKPITVSGTDTKINGDAWVGAGVRFDYRFGLYFIFEADSIRGVSASVNGVEVTPVVYDSSKNLYVIRYSAFDVTDMNEIFTAKVVLGGKEHTLQYSFKSYVASMGNDDSAFAKLVNAAYAYGYAAVAYSGNLILTTEPTFESKGFVSVDSKGYDFTGTPYASIELPKLNSDDYSSSVSRSGDVNPSVFTKFTLKNENFKYSVTVESKDCLTVCRNGQTYLVSKYNYETLNSDIVTVTYDEANGYTYTVAEGETEADLTGVGIRTYGNALTIVGNVEVSCSSRWGHNFALNIGEEGKPASVKLTTTASDYGIVLWDGADMNVRKGSTLVVKGSTPTSICGYASGSYVTIDGTVTVDKSVSIAYNTDWVHPYGDNYGLNPTLYVRKGTLTINDGSLAVNMLQLGSLEEGHVGTLNIRGGGNAIYANNNTKGLRYAFSNGTLNFTSTVEGKTAIDYRSSSSSYIWFDAGMAVNVINEDGGSYSNLVGEWKANNYEYRVAIHSDVKFNLPAETVRIYNNGSSAKFYGNTYSTATVNIDGENKTVLVANANDYRNASFNIPTSDWLTVENADGTRSAAAVVPVEGNYTTVEGSTLVSDWSFKMATYTDSEGTVHTIYYK